MPLHNERNNKMNMLGATTSTVDISKEKLMDDLRAVVADAEELLKATATTVLKSSISFSLEISIVEVVAPSIFILLSLSL